ncbi:Variant surface glycoprotein [Trypanosoma congolense IL3000]|uniref:Variant surface glycoprotein n=1 Tax=Trypanosoma congolense (strain IL3000) TaxID=1068625 RepID=F9WGF2_TRYCI|nr:Variant surface glycoprotein [Trypanosoma congolense IL3000]
MMKVLFFVIVVILGVANVSGEKKNDHNHDAHKALCDVMKAAVGRWGDGGQHLSPSLKQALGKTLFGSEEGKGSVETLRSKLPNDYDTEVKEPGSRFLLCGHQPEVVIRKKQTRWPGHSAPHDLLCLCTPGDGGWPLNNGKAEKLCGKEKGALRGEKNEGWSGSKGKGKDQMTATWTNITRECLQGDEKAGDLQKALGDFMEKLKPKLTGVPKSMYQLGEGDSDQYPCSGIKETGICVMYHNNTSPMPWWTNLKNLLDEEEAKKLEQHEKQQRQSEAPKQKTTQKKENQQFPQEPRSAALRSTTPSTEEVEQINPENISAPLATLEDTSGTLLIQPSSWLLFAVVLI